MPEKPKKYKIVISKDALSDIKSTKKYILTPSNIVNMRKTFQRRLRRQSKNWILSPKAMKLQDM